MITGSTLIEWGFKPGPRFRAMLARADELRAAGHDDEAIRAELTAMLPAAPAILRRREGGRWSEAIVAETSEERDNLALVRAHMAELMKAPVIESGTIMPDACPAGGAPGTIPVGGAVASRGIHPAFHNADICCSMQVSLFAPEIETGPFLDAVHWRSGDSIPINLPPLPLLKGAMARLARRVAPELPEPAAAGEGRVGRLPRNSP